MYVLTITAEGKLLYFSAAATNESLFEIGLERYRRERVYIPNVIWVQCAVKVVCVTVCS